MRTKEIVSIDALNLYLKMGWRLFRAFENGKECKYLLVMEDGYGSKGSKDNSGVQDT